jgi:hypothetical protein
VPGFSSDGLKDVQSPSYKDLLSLRTVIFKVCRQSLGNLFKTLQEVTTIPNTDYWIV